MEDNKIKIAELSTATGESYCSDTQQYRHIVNHQIKFWVDAKEEFELYEELLESNNIHPEDRSYILSIVLKLGTSLTILFGANYKNHLGENTPALKNYIDVILPWKLKIEDPGLYDEFLKLDEFHKNVCKHFDRSKISILDNTTLDDLKQYMETTKKIWLWFIRKKTNGVIIPEAEKEFRKDYV